MATTVDDKNELNATLVEAMLEDEAGQELATQGEDGTAEDEAAAGERDGEAAAAGADATEADAAADADAASVEDDERQVSATRSTALMSVLVVVSRITGFARTWAQAYAVGATVLASCYELANNLPTQIYELVTAGMLVTAFLPVYVSVKRRRGQEGANEYVSNLTSIALILTGAVTLVSFVFASQIIWTQSFSAVDDFDSARATWFFRFFVIEIVLYTLSTIFQGVVNAERDYLWTFLAPIFNNFVVIGSFVGYALLMDTNPTAALLVLALGNPLGVLMQVLLQLPSMRAHGVKLRWKVDLSDPALRDTAKIGVPSIVIMIVAFVANSFQMNALLSFTAIGASIGSYALIWFNLPYAIFAVPITTILFTELSDYYAEGNMRSFKEMVVSGTGKILFLLVPFSLFLIVFADELVTLISAGRFDTDAAALCAYYLRWRAPALAFYGVGMYLQKVCSATRKMDVYALVTVVGNVLQILVLQFVAPIVGLWMVPFSTCLFYLFFDGFILLSVQRDYGRLGLRAILKSGVRSVLLGGAGGAIAMLILRVSQLALAGFGGALMQALLACVVAGIPAVVVTYGLAVALKVPEASTVNVVLNKLLRRV